MISLVNSMFKPGVIVIGNHVQSLGIVRSLGRKNIPVYLINDRRFCIGRFSRYTKKFFLFPAIDDPEKLCRFLCHLAGQEHLKDWLIMPTNDAAVYSISISKETLEKYYKIPTPNWDGIKNAYNKKMTYTLAEKCQIPYPETWYPENFDDAVAISAKIQYPVILKPAIMHHYYKKTRKKAVIVRNSSELLKEYNQFAAVVDPTEIMIQDVIPGRPGELFSFCSFFKFNRSLASCIAQRIRQRPMDCGKGTTFAESVFIPEIAEYGIRLLQEMHYYGLSEVEFKKDPRDGKYKLLEMNARTWLWHSLAIRCGVDFCYLQYRDMLEGTIEPVTSFRTHIKWVHFYTDFGISLNEIIRGRMKIREYINSLRGEKELGVFSSDDILPFIMETISLPYLFLVR